MVFIKISKPKHTKLTHNNSLINFFMVLLALGYCSSSQLSSSELDGSTSGLEGCSSQVIH